MHVYVSIFSRTHHSLIPRSSVLLSDVGSKFSLSQRSPTRNRNSVSEHFEVSTRRAAVQSRDAACSMQRAMGDATTRDLTSTTPASEPSLSGLRMPWTVVSSHPDAHESVHNLHRASHGVAGGVRQRASGAVCDQHVLGRASDEQTGVTLAESASHEKVLWTRRPTRKFSVFV